MDDMRQVSLLTRYTAVRDRTQSLVAGLSAEDMLVQTMPDVSPTKWHLAHTTWFWETFLLRENLEGYQEFSPEFNYLFNSYYDGIGERHPRPERGFLSRPSLSEVMDYRAHTDAAMARLLAVDQDSKNARLEPLIQLGLAHEEQHQELMLTDIKHVLSRHPFAPAAYAGGDAGEAAPVGEPGWVGFDGGEVAIGIEAGGFHFDNEGPPHKTILTPYALADRLATNRDYGDFIADGGYTTPSLWLSDGWARVRSEGWSAPLYWRRSETRWEEFTLHGQQPVTPDAPVIHLSYYEASAFAEWSGARLPGEAEWEHAARKCRGADGRFAQAGISAHPSAASPPGSGPTRLRQMFGDAWEWTRSDYCAYPRYRPAAGAVGEYNGKFMSGQYVLRGGSCATAPGHVRASYRNFFPPEARWQFSGVRLARDI
ncbi:ergothioneine biosynthesis protein EgtB [Maricaulis sp.]|uniref:ergothioneine biosynthesis protein EgtB n=1 Tax=Maricaulis sp. TaxID=1486257 RepID=UPI0025C377AA|nr:ergothioneine biosynthesis protein EgtB [Maricaulis sp.]